MNEKIQIHLSVKVLVDGIKDIANEYIDQRICGATKIGRGRKALHVASVNLPLNPSFNIAF